jgi:hypothetical protein
VRSRRIDSEQKLAGLKTEHGPDRGRRDEPRRSWSPT